MASAFPLMPTHPFGRPMNGPRTARANRIIGYTAIFFLSCFALIIIAFSARDVRVDYIAHRVRIKHLPARPHIGSNHFAIDHAERKNTVPPSSQVLLESDGDYTENQSLDPTGPVIIFGTAGTGTRVLYDILSMAGVRLSKVTNGRQRDSTIFIKKVKMSPFFGIPPRQKNDTRSLPVLDDVPLLEQVRRLNYSLTDVSERTKQKIMESLNAAAEELWTEARKWTEKGGGGVTGKEIVGTLKGNHLWGWKEPQSMFVLPFLKQRFPQMRVVHVVRDGRDIAFSAQQRMRYQKYYIDLFFPPYGQNGTIDVETLNFTLAAAEMWMKTNLQVRDWSSKNLREDQYVVVRLEDICNLYKNKQTIQRLLEQLGLHDLSVGELQKLSSTVEFTKCRLQKFQTKDPKIVKEIENRISAGLTAFGYTPVYGAETTIGQGSQVRDPIKVDNQSVTDIPFESTQEESPFLLLDPSQIDHIRNLTSSLTNSVILLAANTAYASLLENWILHAYAVGVHPNTILIVTSDPDLSPWVYQKFPDLKVVYVSDTGTLNPHKTLYRLRMEVAVTLLESTNVDHVIMTDLDAIGVKEGIAQQVETLHAEKGVDVVASRGRFPREVREVVGATVCMGFLSLRASNATIGILRKTLQNLASNGNDDQKTFNNMLLQDGLKLDDGGQFQENSGLVEMGKTKAGLGLALLPYSMVVRYCSEQQVDQAMVIHCLSKKEEKSKEKELIRLGLWKLTAMQVPT